MNDERWIFQFVAPIRGSRVWRSWLLAVGGWEITGSGKKELVGKALNLLHREEVRLKKLEEAENEPK